MKSPSTSAEKAINTESSTDVAAATPVARSLVRHKWWILGAGLAGGLGLAAMASVQPPSYTASALLLVEPSARTVLDFETVVTDLTSDRVGLETQVGLMTAPPTLAAAAERLVAAGEAGGRSTADVADALASRISARSEGKGNILRLTLTAEDPALAAAWVNAVSDQFLADQIARKREGIEEARTALAARVAELAGEAQAADKAAADFRTTQADAEGSDEFYLDRIATLEDKLVEARANEAMAGTYPEARQRVALLEDALKEVRAGYARFQQTEVVLAPLQDEAAAARHILGEMRERLSEVAEQARFATADTVVLAAATPPQQPSSPARGLLAVMGAATFGLLAALLAVAFDQMSRPGARR